MDDETCEHGVALDVHCCGCHSGFLFDANSCTCLRGDFDEDEEDDADYYDDLEDDSAARCAVCGCDLDCDEHDWDCPYFGDDEDDEDEENDDDNESKRSIE